MLLEKYPNQRTYILWYNHFGRTHHQLYPFGNAPQRFSNRAIRHACCRRYWFEKFDILSQRGIPYYDSVKLIEEKSGNQSRYRDIALSKKG
jgi:hypothetical protein